MELEAAVYMEEEEVAGAVVGRRGGAATEISMEEASKAVA